MPDRDGHIVGLLYWVDTSQPGGAPVQAVWNTYIWVEDSDSHVAVEVADEDVGVSVRADADRDDRPLHA